MTTDLLAQLALNKDSNRGTSPAYETLLMRAYNKQNNPYKSSQDFAEKLFLQPMNQYKDPYAQGFEVLGKGLQALYLGNQQDQAQKWDTAENEAIKQSIKDAATEIQNNKEIQKQLQNISLLSQAGKEIMEASGGNVMAPNYTDNVMTVAKKYSAVDPNLGAMIGNTYATGGKDDWGIITPDKFGDALTIHQKLSADGLKGDDLDAMTRVMAEDRGLGKASKKAKEYHDFMMAHNKSYHYTYGKMSRSNELGEEGSIVKMLGNYVRKEDMDKYGSQVDLTEEAKKIDKTTGLGSDIIGNAFEDYWADVSPKRQKALDELGTNAIHNDTKKKAIEQRKIETEIEKKERPANLLQAFIDRFGETEGPTKYAQHEKDLAGIKHTTPEKPMTEKQIREERRKLTDTLSKALSSPIGNEEAVSLARKNLIDFNSDYPLKELPAPAKTPTPTPAKPESSALSNLWNKWTGGGGKTQGFTFDPSSNTLKKQ